MYVDEHHITELETSFHNEENPISMQSELEGDEPLGTEYDLEEDNEEEDVADEEEKSLEYENESGYTVISDNDVASFNSSSFPSRTCNNASPTIEGTAARYHSEGENDNTLSPEYIDIDDSRPSDGQMHHVMTKDEPARLTSSLRVSDQDSVPSTVIFPIVTTSFTMKKPTTPMSFGSVFAMSHTDICTSNECKSVGGRDNYLEVDDKNKESENTLFNNSNIVSDTNTRVISSFVKKQSTLHSISDSDTSNHRRVISDGDNNSLKAMKVKTPTTTIIPSFTTPNAQTTFISRPAVGGKRTLHPSSEADCDHTSSSTSNIALRTSNKFRNTIRNSVSSSSVMSQAPIHQRYYYALEPEGVAPADKEGKFKPFTFWKNREVSSSENLRDALHRNDINDVKDTAAATVTPVSLPFSRVRDDPDWRRACMLPSSERQLPLHDNLISAAVINSRKTVFPPSPPLSNNFEPIDYDCLFNAALIVHQSLNRQKDTVLQDNTHTSVIDAMADEPSSLSQSSLSMTHAALCQAVAMVRTVRRL